jgi:hypothetical protein
LLARLGRDLELFSILAARYEDASDDERRAMAPRQRAVLERLARAAEENGRTSEASLYRDAASRL